MKNSKINWEQFRTKARRVLNVSWKVALVLVGILSAIVIMVIVHEQYENHYGSSAHYCDKYLSDDICVHSFSSGTVRVYNLKTKEYVTPRLNWVSDTPERDSLTVFCDKNDRRGFLNINTGKIVIDAVFEHAWVFSEGLAAVVEPDGKMGFIDKTDEYVIAPTLDYDASYDYVFKHGVCCIENKDGNQGLLNREGEWVLPQEYSWIDYVAEADMFILTKDGKKGLIRNSSFEWVYPVEYDDITWIEAATGNGFVLYKDYVSKHVSAEGTVIDEFLVDYTVELKYMTKYNSNEADEYAISDKVISFRVYGYWGVMDKHTGRVIVPAKYGNVEMVSENIIKCSLESDSDDDNVLYDLKGNKIE